MVNQSWFTVSETWLQLEIADQMVDFTRELLQLAKERWQIGVGNEYDVVQTRAALANSQDASRQVQLAHEQALRGLELLLGRYPSTELQSRYTMPQLPGPVPAGIPLEVLERRPDIIAAERRIAAAFNREGEAKAAMLPRIILNVNASVVDSDVLELKEDFENPAGGGGAKLLAPIYRGGSLRTQSAIRTLEQKEAVTEYVGMALRALGDVEYALAAGQTLKNRSSFLSQAVVDQERALSLVQTNYRVGRSDLRAVQQQQLSLEAARLQLLRVQSESLSQRVNLHLALGGQFFSAILVGT